MADTKLPTAEMTDDGIKVALSEEEWILFDKSGWQVDDELYFQNANDFTALQIIVEKTKDWKVYNSANALIPFDKKDILDKMDRIKRGERVPFLGLPLKTQSPMAIAFYVALREARTLPNG